jgi:hypothetical protein
LAEERLAHAEGELKLSRRNIPEAIEHLNERGAVRMVGSPKGHYRFERMFITEAGKLYYHQLREESELVAKQAPEMILHPVFKGRDFGFVEDLCFVLMPLKEPFIRIFNEHVKPTIESMEFKVTKADDIFASHVIIDDIWALINQARFIVADVTGKNANVFYELGIADTTGKEIIILTQNEEDIPFDLTHRRYLKYTDNDEGWFKLRNDLKAYVVAITQSPLHEKIISEITNFFEKKGFDVHRDYVSDKVRFDLVAFTHATLHYFVDFKTPYNELTMEDVQSFFTKLHVSGLSQDALPVLMSTANATYGASKLCDELEIELICGERPKEIMEALEEYVSGRES